MSECSSTLPGMMLCAKQHQAKIMDVRAMAQDTWAVKVHAPELASAITPGQFFMIRPATGSDPLLGRPFALFDIVRDAAGQPSGVEFGFVKVGKMTALMSQWSEGDEVSLWGPLGNGFPVPECRHLICVAGGIGQTPFLGVIREALGLESYGIPPRTIATRPQQVSLCYGVRSAGYLAGIEEFTIPGLDLQIATDDGTVGHHGYVTQLLQNKLAQNSEGVHVYCCGPEPMMKAVAEICKAAAVPCWLSLETPMACGFGACFSCVTKVVEPDGSWDYRRTCVEGPVFRAEQLVL
ncbi:MAG: dihydroorotate dehydrogenase electron transfer subunit [Planctomycetota bacterium]|nr:MAG: dihydroorotate dehydrogenase electron transfer subunit [Planctomycetota bacterium]